MHLDRSRYLTTLGIDPTSLAGGGLPALARVVRAHLQAIPFENISKLLDRRHGRIGIPDLETFLDRIERHRFGGTCYSIAIHLHGLLTGLAPELGIEVDLCGAAMSRPDVHAVIQARCDGRRFLVDVGYGAPLDHPLPLDLDRPYDVSLGTECFRLQPPGPDGCSRLDHLRSGERIHGYVMSPEPRRAEDFELEIHRSFDDDSTFMRAVRAVRFQDGRSLALANLSLVESSADGVRRARLTGTGSAVDTLVHRFGMTEALVREALSGIDLQQAFDPGG